MYKLKNKNYFIIQDEERMTVNDTITMVLVKELWRFTMATWVLTI